jgi:hypothetical protein
MRKIGIALGGGDAFGVYVWPFAVITALIAYAIWNNKQ